MRPPCRLSAPQEQRTEAPQQFLGELAAGERAGLETSSPITEERAQEAAQSEQQEIASEAQATPAGAGGDRGKEVPISELSAEATQGSVGALSSMQAVRLQAVFDEMFGPAISSYSGPDQRDVPLVSGRGRWRSHSVRRAAAQVRIPSHRHTCMP